MPEHLGYVTIIIDMFIYDLISINYMVDPSTTIGGAE